VWAQSLDAAPQTVAAMEGLHDGQGTGLGRGGGRKAAAVAGHSKVVARAAEQAAAATAATEAAMAEQLKQQEADHANELAALRGALRQELESLHQVSFLGDVKSLLGDVKSLLGDAKSLLGDAKSSLGDAKSSLGDAKSSLGDAKSSLGDAKSSLGDAKSSLGDAKSSLGDAKSSLGDVQAAEQERHSLHISPAQQELLESQIAAARAALESTGGGGAEGGARPRTRGAGGREAAVMRQREAAMEAKYGPAPHQPDAPHTTADGGDAQRQAHLRKQLFWQGEKSRLQYAQQKAVLKAELAETMAALRHKQTHADPEELVRFQEEVHGLRLMLERQDWMDDSERQYLDLEAAVEEGDRVTPLQAALEQQQQTRRRGMRGRRGLDAAVARRRQEKVTTETLKAADRKARDMTREQKQRRLELAVEEKRQERRVERRAARAVKQERQREIQV
jgi:hypothetical protein